MSEDNGATLVVGLHIPQTNPDAARLLQSAREDGYDYVTTALPKDASKEVRKDVMELESRWWRTSVVGRIDEAQEDLAKSLDHQLEWAIHMNIPAVILPPIPQPLSMATDYARLVGSLALKAGVNNGQVWVTTCLNAQSLAAFDILHRQCDGASNIGMLLKFDNVQPSTSSTGAVAILMTLLHKSVGSQLKALCFPTKVFLTNKRGYPALSKTHQVLFTELLRRVGRTLRVLIEGPSSHPLVRSNTEQQNSGVGSTECLPYLQYIRHMRQRKEVAQVLDSADAALEEPYLDHLQRPLQPLSDHLEFSTYETFEKDPVKYNQYQKALELALRDNLVGVHNREVHIVVAGAGRGPLVNACIAAIEETPNIPHSVLFFIHAVEKNPSAVVYLQAMAQNDPNWHKPNVRVFVVASDMRNLTRDTLFGGRFQSISNPANAHGIDIVVSELLGSFGDNELSPECLDAIYENNLMKEGTVCIPCHYTSYLAPVSSLRLHSEARAQAYFPASSADGLNSPPMGMLQAMETPYVVRCHSASQTHEELPCWEFSHPSTSTDNDNEKASHLEFRPDTTMGTGRGPGYGRMDPAVASMAQATNETSPSMPMGWTVHGLLGTFSATLYQSPRDDTTITIATCPSKFSVGMFSWFPLYFPFREPLCVAPGATLACSMWRKRDGTRVWYEWCCAVYAATSGVVTEDSPMGASATATPLGVSPIHNPNGRSSHMNL